MRAHRFDDAMVWGLAEERGQAVKALWLNDGQNLFRDEDRGLFFDRNLWFYTVFGKVECVKMMRHYRVSCRFDHEAWILVSCIFDGCHGILTLACGFKWQTRLS